MKPVIGITCFIRDTVVSTAFGDWERHAAVLPSAYISVISKAGVDVILVGDSLGMVVQGHDSTLPVTMDQLIYHLECVVQGNQGSHIMADMPFMS